MRAFEINAASRNIFLKIGPSRIAVLLLVLAQKSARAQEPQLVDRDLLEFSRSRIIAAYDMLNVTMHEVLQEIGHELSPKLSALGKDIRLALKPLNALCARAKNADDVFIEHLATYGDLETTCIINYLPKATKFIGLFIDEMEEFADNKALKEKQKSANSLDEVADLGMRIQMVAINASIEAARAGEVGRGFSVIAEETKSLAHTMTTVLGEISDDLRRI